MTGTSIDALDACAVRLEGTGLEIRASLVAWTDAPLGALAPRLRALASGEAMTAGDIARLALDFAAPHTEALKALRAKAGAPDLVAVHGQTVFHAPPASWQLLNPWPIAREAGCPVVFDMRGADLAAGGQGAPITPLADWILFRDARESRAIVNLGGFCNATILPACAGPESVRGLDVCACNHVLDGVARRALGQPFDTHGASASTGSVHAEASRELAALLAAQSRSARSLGTGDEATRWIDAWVAPGGPALRAGSSSSTDSSASVGASAGSENRPTRSPRAPLAPNDLAASAADALGATIAATIPSGSVIYCAGGGARNRALLAAIARHAGSPVEITQAWGVPIEQREAAEIAILGALCQDGVPITLPAVTRLPAGASVHGGGGAPIAGAWAFPHAMPR